jgi:arsenate reductase
MIVYQYPKCSTSRKALKFLNAAGVDFQAKDIVAKPPSKSALKKARKLSGVPLNKLFNTSGQSYRNGGFKEKLKTMSDAQAFAALAADGKLIKRPLVIGDGFVLVGFREDEWREALGL